MPRNMSGAAYRRHRRERGLAPYTPGERTSQQRLNERRAALRITLDAIKIERGCADCGYREHAVALDFDHLPGYSKVGDLARLAQMSPAVALAEVEKCEVVCSNCHRVRTHIRRVGT